MIYYDRKGYENLRDAVFKLEDLWKKMLLKDFIIKTVLCLVGFALIGWGLRAYFLFLTQQEEIMTINYTDLYKKKNKEDERNKLRIGIENLHEMVKSNNERINNLVDRYHELYNDLSKFKRHVLEKEKLEKQWNCFICLLICFR